MLLRDWAVPVKLSKVIKRNMLRGAFMGLLSLLLTKIGGKEQGRGLKVS